MKLIGCINCKRDVKHNTFCPWCRRPLKLLPHERTYAVGDVVKAKGYANGGYVTVEKIIERAGYPALYRVRWNTHFTALLTADQMRPIPATTQRGRR